MANEREFQIIRDKYHGLFVEIYDQSGIPGVGIEIEYGIEDGGNIWLTLDEARRLADFLTQQLPA